MTKIIALLFITTVFCNDALGCSCKGPPSIQNLFSKYDNIFVAKITGGVLADEPSSDREYVLAQYDVVESIKGESDEVTISVNAYNDFVIVCPVVLRIGGQYLIYVDSTKQIHLDYCHPSSRPFRESTILTLRKLARSSSTRQ